jgi:hypothetical protein
MSTYPLSARDRRGGRARARRGSRPCRRRDLDRDRSGRRDRARGRGGTRRRHHRRAAAGRRGAAAAFAGDRDCRRDRRRRCIETATPLLRVAGDARAILSAERVSLNFLGHLSGIAIATAAFVARVPHQGAHLLHAQDHAGPAALAKCAVRWGGGFNHRFGLDDAILIKDNRIAVAGGIAAVLARA